MTSISKRPNIISIEGNIGAGKSTLLREMEKIIKEKNITSICILQEPLHLWSNVKDTKTGETILEKFYKDNDAWAFPFQIMAFNTRLSEMRRIIKENPNCQLIICERSLEADANVFAKMLYQDGKIDDICYQIYRQTYSMSEEEFRMNGIVFLNIPPDVCAQRIQKRGRSGEDNISLDYLKKCYDMHIDWLSGESDKDSRIILPFNEKELDKLLQHKQLENWLEDLVALK